MILSKPFLKKRKVSVAGGFYRELPFSSLEDTSCPPSLGSKLRNLPYSSLQDTSCPPSLGSGPRYLPYSSLQDTSCPPSLGSRPRNLPCYSLQETCCPPSLSSGPRNLPYSSLQDTSCHPILGSRPRNLPYSSLQDPSCPLRLGSRPRNLPYCSLQDTSWPPCPCSRTRNLPYSSLEDTSWPPCPCSRRGHEAPVTRSSTSAGPLQGCLYTSNFRAETDELLPHRNKPTSYRDASAPHRTTKHRHPTKTDSHFSTANKPHPTADQSDTTPDKPYPTADIQHPTANIHQRLMRGETLPVHPSGVGVHWRTKPAFRIWDENNFSGEQRPTLIMRSTVSKTKFIDVSNSKKQEKFQDLEHKRLVRYQGRSEALGVRGALRVGGSGPPQKRVHFSSPISLNRGKMEAFAEGLDPEDTDESDDTENIYEKIRPTPTQILETSPPPPSSCTTHRRPNVELKPTPNANQSRNGNPIFESVKYPTQITESSMIPAESLITGPPPKQCPNCAQTEKWKVSFSSSQSCTSPSNPMLDHRKAFSPGFSLSTRDSGLWTPNLQAPTSQVPNLEASFLQVSTPLVSTSQTSNLQVTTSQTSNLQVTTSQDSNLQDLTSQGLNLQVSTSQTPNLQNSPSQAPNLQDSSSQAPTSQTTNLQAPTLRTHSSPQTLHMPSVHLERLSSGLGSSHYGSSSSLDSSNSDQENEKDSPLSSYSSTENEKDSPLSSYFSNETEANSETEDEERSPTSNKSDHIVGKTLIASSSGSDHELTDSLARLTLFRSISKGRRRYLETYSGADWDFGTQDRSKPRLHLSQSLPHLQIACENMKMLEGSEKQGIMHISCLKLPHTKPNPDRVLQTGYTKPNPDRVLQTGYTKPNLRTQFSLVTSVKQKFNAFFHKPFKRTVLVSKQ